MPFEASRPKYFPVELPVNVTGRWVDRDTAFEVGAIMQIFDHVARGHFQTPPARREKANQLARARIAPGSESVAFYDEADNPVGWFWGYMEFPDTFFIDTFGLIPAYRGQGIYQAFMRTLIAYLTDVGYERLIVSTGANNRAMLIANLKSGFSIVGMEIGENTGVLVKLAYHLHADRREDFVQAFRLTPDDPPMPSAAP
jgi:GNAT superfamily N-acetyltransferase